ncbi:MAG: DEAD/DEAH box helicase [Alphaproteobacteria bacterium]|nr:MAG: DEAD/DEAH box helicase [Alphaproteobacteria bacterium]
MTDFSALSLSEPVLRALENQNFTTPTAIQTATIPALMNGNDVIGVAQTGGGKTAAFVIPMLERLALETEKPKPGMPRALILAPTRELAMQITSAIQDLARFLPIKSCTIYGGAPYRTQLHILRRGVDILVATPGRLMDHMKQGNIYLDETGYFVLDEADRMLDMGFVDDVRLISARLPVGHQSVMFSATMNPAIKELANTLLNEPEHIQVAAQASIADNLTHKVLFTAREHKTDLLLHMIEERGVYKALVFTRTRADADELCDILQDHGLKADAIHGDKQQRQRQRIIQSFRDDRINFLVATDVAARGIDVPDVTHVFNTDVPVESENYVHRIGRTARGGASGEAFTFCSRGEIGLLRAVERVIKQSIEVEENNPFPQVIGKKRSFVKPEGRTGRPQGGKCFGDNAKGGQRREFGGEQRGEFRPKRDRFEGEGREGRDDFRPKRREFDGEQRGEFRPKRDKFEGQGREERGEFRPKRREFDGEQRGDFRPKRDKFEGQGREERGEFRPKRREFDGEQRGDFRPKRDKFEGQGREERGEFRPKRREFDGEQRGEFRPKRDKFEGQGREERGEFRPKRREFDGEQRGDFRPKRDRFEGEGREGRENREGRGEFKGKRREFDGEKRSGEFRPKREGFDGEKRGEFKAKRGEMGKRTEIGRGKKTEAGKGAPRKKAVAKGGNKPMFKKRAA